tara:strand:+ start:189 stop:923 length:735 start_codon:yes stop_codon:yes gene_type:complete
VRNNLKLVFPKKTKKDLQLIEKKYYRNLSDVFLESFKSMNIKEEEMKKRFHFTNPEVLEQVYDSGRNLIIMGSHYCTWEWCFIMDRVTRFKINAVYKKIANPYLNRWAKKIRSKYDCELITTNNTYRKIAEQSKEKKLHLYGFASDQSPSKKKAFYYNKFLNITVPIHIGAEIIAKKYDMPMLFMDVIKVKRGFYEATFKEITYNPKNFKNFKLTDIFIKMVEEQIHRKPEFYTWTHRRFKHKI